MGYFSKFNTGKGIPFMNDAEKGDFKEIIGSPVHIADFGFIRNEDGDFAVISVKERPGRFYFCNQIVTEMLHTVDDDGMRKELVGEPIAFEYRTSKKGREYLAFEFVGEQDELPF